MEEIRVKDVFPLSGGIMAAISSIGSYDFNGDMDLLLLSKCGNRLITPVVELILEGGDRLSQAQIERLAALIMSEYGDAWGRVKEALQLEYNPLSASAIHEEESTNTEGETGNQDEETQAQDVSAVNVAPSTYVPDTQVVSNTSSTGTSRNNVRRTLDRTSNGTSFKSSDLLKSEIEMRVNSLFTSQVLEDVKNYIAMMIY